MTLVKFLSKFTLPALVKANESQGGVVPNFTGSESWLRFFGIEPSSEMSFSKDNFYSTVASVYRAVNVISSSIAQLPIVAEKKKPDGSWDDVSDKREFQIFKKPNRIQTKYDFIELTMMYLELRGACPYLVNRLKNGRITELLPFDPNMLIVHEKNNFEADYYEININGKFHRLELSDILLLKYTDPSNPTGWISPIEAANRDIKLDLYASYSMSQTFKNDSRPSGILSTDAKISVDEFDKVRDKILSMVQGMKNRGNILPVGHGFKYTPITMAAKDMQLIEQRGWTQNTVSEVFGVPPIYMMRFKEASVLANADVQEKLLWHSLMPKIIKIQEVIQRFWLPSLVNDYQGYRIKFDVFEVSALAEDRKEKAELFGKGFALGAISPNEYRYYVLGLDEVDDPDLDSFYLPFNIFPIGSSQISPEKKAKKQLDDIINKTKDISLSSINETLFNIKRKDTETEAELEKIRVSKAVLRLADTEADKFAKVLKSLFKEQRDEVVANILAQKNYQKQTTEITGVLFDFDEWAERFGETGKPYISGALTQAAQALADELGDIIDLENPNIINFVNEQSIQYATIVNETTVTDIDRVIGQGLVDGLSVAQVADRVKDYFDQQAEFRSIRIARTEMMRGVNKGRLEAMDQSPTVQNHMWLTSRDEKVRDTHYDIEGRIVKVGDDFDCPDPTMMDQTFPSAINERCTTMPTDEKANYP